MNFKATLDDNFFAVIGLGYDSQDIVGSHASENSGLANTHGGLSGVNSGENWIGFSTNGWGGKGNDSFSIRHYYAGFTGLPYTTVLFGRQPAGLFFTDNIVATGLKVSINPLEGLSFAGMFFTNFEDDGELGMLPFELKEDPAKPGKYTATSYIHQKNLWSLAAMYQNEMLDIEAWYTGINKVANLFALSAGLSYGINDNVSLRSKAQWAYTNLTNKFKENYRGIMAAPNEIPVANSNFFGIELGASFHGFDIDAGYITYGKKDKTSIQSIEDQGSFISAGEELLDFTSFEGKHKVWFAKAKYTYDAYFIGVDYVCDKVKNAPRLGKNAKASEWVVRAGYKYNDKLKFNAWYSMTTQKYDTIDFATGGENKSKDKFNRLRFDAVYNF